MPNLDENSQVNYLAPNLLGVGDRMRQSLPRASCSCPLLEEATLTICQAFFGLTGFFPWDTCLEPSDFSQKSGLQIILSVLLYLSHTFFASQGCFSKK